MINVQMCGQCANVQMCKCENEQMIEYIINAANKGAHLHIYTFAHLHIARTLPAHCPHINEVGTERV